MVEGGSTGRILHVTWSGTARSPRWRSSCQPLISSIRKTERNLVTIRQRFTTSPSSPSTAGRRQARA